MAKGQKGVTVEFTPTGKPVNHGIVSSYSQYGCRCPLCTEANRVYRSVFQQGTRLARTRANAIPETVVHGKVSTYVNWGCRCRPCTEAQTESCKSYYARTLSKEARNQRAKNAYVVGYIDGATGLDSDSGKVED